MANAMSPDQCAEELALLLSSQAGVCRRILEKSQRQQRLVEERDEDALLVLLSEKQELIGRHQQLSDKSRSCRAQWEAGARERAAPAAHARVEAAWNELRTVLDEVVRLEDASRTLLEEQKSRMSVDINHLQRGKIVNKAYGGAAAYRPPPRARYSDRQG